VGYLVVGCLAVGYLVVGCLAVGYLVVGCLAVNNDFVKKFHKHVSPIPLHGRDKSGSVWQEM